MGCVRKCQVRRHATGRRAIGRPGVGALRCRCLRLGGFGVEKEIDLHRPFEETLGNRLDAVAELVLDPVELETVGGADLQPALVHIELTCGQGFDPRRELLGRQFIAKLFRAGAPKIVHRIPEKRGVGCCIKTRMHRCVGLVASTVRFGDHLK